MLISATSTSRGEWSGGRLFRRRLIAALVAAASGSILVVAAWLEPSPAGLGTHRNLGLPSCGWMAAIGTPCPTCGMTTAFAHAADGHLHRSFLAQPAGFLLALATAMTLLISLYVTMTGSGAAAFFGRWLTPATGWLLGGVVLAGWIYKIIMVRGGWG